MNKLNLLLPEESFIESIKLVHNYTAISLHNNANKIIFIFVVSTC